MAWQWDTAFVSQFAQAKNTDISAHVHDLKLFFFTECSAATPPSFIAFVWSLWNAVWVFWCQQKDTLK